MKAKKLVGGLAVALVCGAFSFASARMMEGVRTGGPVPVMAKVAAIPNTQQCVHKVGRLWFTVTNYGFFGDQGPPHTLRDCLTGAITSSAEFPGGSKIEYLFQGTMWLGAISGDTIVSTGHDGWLGTEEMFPEDGDNGAIIRRTTNQSNLQYYSPEAKSDQDFIATMFDTLTDCNFAACISPYTGKPHDPLGVKIIQSSYSWAAGWGQDWVMLDFKVVNIGRKPLTKIFMGIFIDADVGHPSNGSIHLDDLSGFKLSVPNEDAPACFLDTINLSYISDNDGDPVGTSFGPNSATAVTGVRVVRAPGQVETAFNWWTPNGDVTVDWGPQKAPGRQNFSGGLGQPEGDAHAYFQMANKEFDYDQVYCAIPEAQRPSFIKGKGWLGPLSPQAKAVDIANGYDTRYTLSFGPFNLSPGDTLPVTLGYIAGEGFHKDPRNFANNLGTTASNYLDSARVLAYQQGLDFTAIASNARWVQRVYDNEDFEDTVLCQGQPVIRRHGDGIPDFKGPQPPIAPVMEFITSLGEVTVRWFGRKTETSVDEFSKIVDFEGYRILISTDGRGYTTIGSFDKVDWKPYMWNAARRRWDPAPSPPLTYDELQKQYAVKWDTCANKPGNITKPIDPERYNKALAFNQLPGIDLTRCNPDTTRGAIRIRFCLNCGPQGTPVDTIFHFVRQDYNLGLQQIKLYPSVTDTSNDSAYWYEYRFGGLFPSLPVYIAVAPFDFGFLTPTQKLDPLEMTPTASARLVYALSTEASRKALDLKVSVYPNPYRIDHDYSFFEQPDQSVGEAQRSQILNFINLPSSCIIRIYTLDGDLVQEIKHEKSPTAPDAGFDQWNLLTRNTQTVAAGLYLYTVQSSEATQLGKIVIIK